jgi:ribosomal protein S18 acetylase RimI-like enzyme
MADPPYSLRQATNRDYAFLYALHRKTMREYIEPIWGWHEEWQEEYFQKKFDPFNRQIVQVGGRDAGVLVLEEREGETYLSLIEILPEYQNRRLGSRLVMGLIERAQQRNQRLTLHVLKSNIPALRLYQRLGFIIEAEEEYRYKMVFH